MERCGRAHGTEGRAGEPAQRVWNQDRARGGIWVSETGGTDERTVLRRLSLLLTLTVQMNPNCFQSFCCSGPDSNSRENPSGPRMCFHFAFHCPASCPFLVTSQLLAAPPITRSPPRPPQSPHEGFPSYLAQGARLLPGAGDTASERRHEQHLDSQTAAVPLLRK